MAIWNDGFNLEPAGSESPGLGDDRIRETRVEVDSRIDQEHEFHDTAATGQSVHKPGSAVAYVDVEETDPTLRPDGSTSLGTGDDGRLKVNSDTDTLRWYCEDDATWHDVTIASSGGETVYYWRKIADPATGWAGFKISSWTADSFTGGLTVDFTGVVTAGTIAVKVVIKMKPTSTSSKNSFSAYWRAYGDTNISDTPSASQEYSHLIGYVANESYYTAWEDLTYTTEKVLYLDENYRAQIAVDNPATAGVYVSNPFEELR